MAHPMRYAEETRSQQVFQALLWALSYPGRRQALPNSDDPFVAIGATLIDLETTFFTPDHDLARRLGFSGARPAPISSAMYQFFPDLGKADLETLAAAPTGSYTYPDTGATLVLGCTFDSGTLLRLRGPGIPGTTEILVGGLPETFWDLRREVIHYPLGWEVFLVAGNRVVGIPRSCVVEVL
ncbi:MAG: phosphonate C-P lyase system protein PhnH [Oscillochloris sp.]|nr:phosphonate C-P lyase system protein PhnH [Oscillochloris sp.]